MAILVLSLGVWGVSLALLSRLGGGLVGLLNGDGRRGVWGLNEGRPVAAHGRRLAAWQRELVTVGQPMEEAEQAWEAGGTGCRDGGTWGLEDVGGDQCCENK